MVYSGSFNHLRSESGFPGFPPKNVKMSVTQRIIESFEKQKKSSETKRLFFVEFVLKSR